MIESGEIRMREFSGYWKSEKPVLENITLHVQPGECVAIVGKVGSGKSSLLSCLLREIPRYKGDFTFKGRIAYVE